MGYEGKLYFVTGNHKNVYKELRMSPFTQICVASPQYEWIRIQAKVNFFKDRAIAQKIWDSYEGIHGLYSGIDDPRIEFFYLSECEVQMCSFSKAPETFRLP